MCVPAGMQASTKFEETSTGRWWISTGWKEISTEEMRSSTEFMETSTKNL
ncbi:hypothetical protein ABRT01_13465 [Lentibacillus sp. L22]|nr:hypothetical protein [Lentibacillus daqui]